MDGTGENTFNLFFGVNGLKYRIYHLDQDNELGKPRTNGLMIIEAPRLEDAYAIFKEQEGTELEDNPLALVPLCPKCGGSLITLEYTERIGLEVNQYGTYVQTLTNGIFKCPVCKENIGWVGEATGDPSTDKSGFTPDFE